MAKKKVKIADGLELDMTLRVIGLQYLEEVYEKPISEIDFEARGIKDMVRIFTALGLSTYPDMTPEEIQKKIDRLGIDDLNRVMAETPDVFRVQSKNSKRPSVKKVKGNLTES